MAKIVASLLLTVALSYIAECATRGDQQGAIGEVGSLLRVEAIQRIRGAAAGASAGGLGPVQANCLHVQLNQAFVELNRVLVTEQQALRREAVARTDEELAPLTLEQLREGVRARLGPVVEEVVTNQEAAIGNCAV